MAKSRSTKAFIRCLSGIKKSSKRRLKLKEITLRPLICTDRGGTLIIQVSKSVLKYGRKINAEEKNYVLHKTGGAFLAFQCDFTSAKNQTVLV